MSHYFKYFTQDDEKRMKSGLVPPPFGVMTGRERFMKILQDRQIHGSKGKGYFHKLMKMPCSVSLTVKALESLDRFYVDRGAYAITFDRGRVKKDLAHPVLYLSDQQIRAGEFLEEDRWLVDVIRPYDVYDEDQMTGELVLLDRKYDFSWQEEWRIRGLAVGFDYNKVAFVIVPNEKQDKVVRGEFPVESFIAKENYARVQQYRHAHGGAIPPLEDTVHVAIERLAAHGRRSDPAHGIYIMPEALECAWDVIKNIGREQQSPGSA